MTWRLQSGFVWMLAFGWTLFMPVQHRLYSAEDESRTEASPAAAAKAMSVQRCLLAAQTFYDMERYGQAFKRFEQTLVLDPDNADANAGKERIRETLEKQNLIRFWLHLLRHSSSGAIIQSIEDRFNRIVIPEVDFRQMPFADAVEFLRREGRRLDAGPRACYELTKDWK